VTRFSFSQFRGVAYRATSYDTPLWVFPNRRPGRWNDPDDGTIAQYCTLDAAAPLAEFVRHEDLRQPEDAGEVRLALWQLRLMEGAVLDLSSPEKAGDQGVAWDDLVADDWRACQQLARDVLAEGGRGVIAPCAALPGSLSLTVFGARSEIGWNAERRLAIQVPAREISRGAPGVGVVRSARFFGCAYPKDVPLASVDHMLELRPKR
jgi:RES domain-containing protein